MRTQRSMAAVILYCVLALTGCSALTSTPTSIPISTPEQSRPSEVPAETAPVVTSLPSVAQDEGPDFVEARENMVTRQIEGRGISDPAVLAAMRRIPRHRFVPEDYLHQAYADHPLPIGYGQTISQPYIVAWMTELLELEPDFRVMEIGTGSGYQAAVLAEIVAEVYTIEIISELADSAEARLKDLGYDNVHVLRADGYWGWEEFAPFDAIIVTAAPDHLPLPLTQQLKDGSHLVLPIGPRGGYQSLWQFKREGEALVAREIAAVRFVPFTREDE